MRLVIGYTTCATMSGTRSGPRLTCGLGYRTTGRLTDTTRFGNTTVVRISASCIFSNATRVPCARSYSPYPSSMCNAAGLRKRCSIVGCYRGTMIVHAS